MIIECLTSFLSFWFIVPPQVHASISRGLPQLSAEYDEPLDFCRVNTRSVNIELNPSMVPFVTHFRVETDLKHDHKVLVTYSHVNHNNWFIPNWQRSQTIWQETWLITSSLKNLK